MKLADFQKNKEQDKLEFVKQQQVEIQKILDYKIIPHENHLLFEFNLKDKSLQLAEFLPPKTLVSWNEALEMYYKRVISKVNITRPSTITKSELIKKDGCIYISALNEKNALKIIKRDFNYLE